MAIQAVSTAGQNRSEAVSSKTVKAAEAVTAEGTAVTAAAVYEGSVESVQTKTYTRDTATLDDINKQVEAKLGSLRSTVESLLAQQGSKAELAKGFSYEQVLQQYDGKLKDFFQSLQVDEGTRLKAQEEIGENGFWGVKQTSERILSYAKAISGGDPSKLGLLRTAIEDGYKAAEKSWGGQLPDICKQTQDAVLKGLDEMGKTTDAASAKATAE